MQTDILLKRLNELLIDATEIVPGMQVLVLGALDGTLAVEAARRLAPDGTLYLADYDSAALEHAADALRAAGIGGVAVLSPDQVAEFAPASLDAVLLQIVSFASSALLVRLLHDAGRALRPGALLYAAGPREKGIISFGRRMEEMFGAANPVRYAKGNRVIAAVRPEQWRAELPASPQDVQTVEVRGQTLQLELRDGVFARGGLDEGSLLLCAALELAPDAHLLDLGCGGGIVGMIAAQLAPQGRATLIDSNTAAVELAHTNLARNRISNATALLSDGIASVEQQRFNVVATNPPFHQGRVQTTDTALRFIADAPRVRSPVGRFYLVCNRFLPYQRPIVAAFGNAHEVGGNGRYRVLLAQREA